MANFTTDAEICIKREIDVTNNGLSLDDLVSRFDIIATCKWIQDNSYERVMKTLHDLAIKM